MKYNLFICKDINLCKIFKKTSQKLIPILQKINPNTYTETKNINDGSKVSKDA